MSKEFTYAWKNGEVIKFAGPVMSYEIGEMGLTGCHLYEPDHEHKFWTYHSDKWVRLNRKQVDKEFLANLLLLGIA